jgi:hypothetical protein
MMPPVLIRIVRCDDIGVRYLVAMHRAGKRIIDPAQVMEYTTRAGEFCAVGGAAYLAELVDSVPARATTGGPGPGGRGKLPRKQRAEGGCGFVATQKPSQSLVVDTAFRMKSRLICGPECILNHACFEVCVSRDAA